MKVIIQNVTPSTKRRFKDIKSFPTVITLSGKHNHSQVSAEALRQGRVLPKTKKMFEGYFEQGMSINHNYLM